MLASSVFSTRIPLYGNAHAIFCSEDWSQIIRDHTMLNHKPTFQALSQTRMLLDTARVLVVEDDRISRLMLVEILKSHGITQIQEAKDGMEGLEKAKAWNPSLIILDIRMPRLNGLEFCREMRADPELADIPIIVQTGSNDIASKSEIFAAGATDFIAKPVEPHELAARSFVHLERQQLIDSLKDYKRRLSHELELARRMQMVLVPDDEYVRTLEQKYAMDIYHQFRPCSELGGDLWGMRPIDGQRLAIFTSDFTGHGVDAALNTFRQHTLMHNMPELLFSQPCAYLVAMNHILKDLLPVHQFATMFYGVIDTDAEELLYASAGCPSPILCRANGDVEVLANEGIPLGIDSEAAYSLHRTPFLKGDTVVLYSDALIETPHHQTGNDLDDEYLQQKLKAELSVHPLKTAFTNVMAFFDAEYASNCRDDFTLCAYKRR